jgi:predicted ribosome quality control (RQC) complex YloA/Tae2 family protein
LIKQKKSMTSFDIVAVVNELNTRLRNVRLNNIYAYGKGLMLRFKGGGVDARVVAVPGERVHLSRYDITEKSMPPPFIMGLRKYLRGLVLDSVHQLDFDRIVEFVFKKGDQVYRLIVEVLPRGIIALLNRDGVIVQVNTVMKLKDREIKRGVQYQPPPSSSVSPEELSKERVLSGLAVAEKDKECNAVRFLVRLLGYPGEVVEEALLRVGLSPEAGCGEVAKVADDLVESFREIYTESLGSRGYIVYDDNAPLTIVPFKPRMLVEHYGFRIEEFGSFSDAADEYFVEILKAVEEEKKASHVEAERAKLLSSLEKAKKSLEELKAKMEKAEKKAQLIAENISLLYEALECARRYRETAGWEYIPGNCPGVVDVRPSEGKILVNIDGVIVDIDIRSDPSQLVVDLYKRVGEIRAKVERGRKAVEELERKLRELDELQKSIRVEARAKIRRKEWYERYHWLVTSNGFLAIGGRDADQNESMVKRYLNPRRIFMHADIHGAPVVVVFAEGHEPPETDLREAALLTAAYSKAWKSGIGSVDVYWVWGNQVSKSPPPGEYISKGAFMVYGKRNYIRGVELRLALGVGKEDDYPVVIIGPEHLVKRRSLVYAVLIPGDEDPSLLAKSLKKRFYKNASDEHRELISALSVEDIRERIPGRSRLLSIAKGDALEPARPIKYIFQEENG